MTVRWTLCCALLLGVTSLGWGADTMRSNGNDAQSPSKSTVTHLPKAAARRESPASAGSATPSVPSSTSRPPPRGLRRLPPKAIPSPPAPILRGSTQTLTCRQGTDERHARIGIVLVGGKTDSFAYYSTGTPRTCSIHAQRNRAGYRKWVDKGNTTRINLERGLMVIEHAEGEYRFMFQDIDRQRYCGMEGTINGTLTIRRGSERCELAGIMDEVVPLGQGYPQRKQTGRAAPEPQPRNRTTQQSIIPSVPAWPSAGN